MSTLAHLHPRLRSQTESKELVGSSAGRRTGRLALSRGLESTGSLDSVCGVPTLRMHFDPLRNRNERAAGVLLICKRVLNATTNAIATPEHRHV